MPANVRLEQPTRPIAHLVPSRRSAEEDLAWARLYAVVHRSSTAGEVVKHLDADPLSKREHLALYILARITLSQQKSHQARRQRLVAFIRLALTVLVVRPLRSMAQEYALIRDTLLAAMPATRKEPATKRAGSLKCDSDFASPTDLFRCAAAAPSATGNSSGASLHAA